MQHIQSLSLSECPATSMASITKIPTALEMSADALVADQNQHLEMHRIDSGSTEHPGRGRYWKREARLKGELARAEEQLPLVGQKQAISDVLESPSWDTGKWTRGSDTKLCVHEFEGVSRKLGFNCCFGVDCDRSGNGRSGGLGLLWKSDLEVTIQSFSLHHIDALVGGDFDWRLTGIYGHPEDCQKWHTWALLDRLGVGFSGRWLCMGDFNEIMFGYEKMGGVLMTEGRMVAFKECLERNGLSDVGYTGHAYTWSNK
ncbi:hypothetical protein ACS0TY_035044 [Phlomoides rotata]